MNARELGRTRGRSGVQLAPLAQVFLNVGEHVRLRAIYTDLDTLSASFGEALYSLRELVGDLSPVVAAISHLSMGLKIGRAGSMFSERPVSLRSSGLRNFGTVLEILTFRRTYEFQRKVVLRLPSDRRERPISNSPFAAIRHLSSPGGPTPDNS
jgi:hypothetical protein